MINKKAQLGSTLAWFVGLIVVILAMVIYFGVAGVIVVNKGIDKSTIEEMVNVAQLSDTSYFLNREEIDFSKEPPKIVKDFVEEGRLQIYNFIDNEKILTGLEYNEYVDYLKGFSTVADLDAVTLYERLFSRYAAYMLDKEFSEPYFYIRSGQKEMQIFYEHDEFGWSMNSGEDVFYQQLRPDDENTPKYINENKYYFVTDEGNLFMIVFYEKEEAFKLYA